MFVTIHTTITITNTPANQCRRNHSVSAGGEPGMCTEHHPEDPARQCAWTHRRADLARRTGRHAARGRRSLSALMDGQTAQIDGSRGTWPGRPAAGCDRLAGVNDDVELLDAWKGGDRRAGATLFERHYPGVLRFFHNKAGEHGKDLIQRTFLRCLEARDRILPGSSFRAYLFGVARNVLLEHFRSVKRDGDRLDEMLTTVQDVSPHPTPSSFIAHKREARLLLAALRKIPIELQITLELFYWEGMPAGEIGDAFAVPEGTVRTRLRRARQLLEQEIAALASSPAELHSTMSGLADWAAQV